MVSTGGQGRGGRKGEGCQGKLAPVDLAWGFSEGSCMEGVCALHWAGGQGPCCHIREAQRLPLCP